MLVLMKKKVVVGMSGGVDSSVAALILKKQGYQVVGVYMKNWEERDGDGVCTSEKDYEDVKRVCNALDIPYYIVNYAKEYKERVFNHFLKEYQSGRTPNPDVLCNREIKFGPFLQNAMNMGADYIATGHYAKIVKEKNQYCLYKPKDLDKDQTYFLNQLNQTQLEKTMFPLDGLLKSEVRKIAKDNNIPTAEKKDSTGICFIGERDFRKFLMNYFPNKNGKIITTDGRQVGEHIGLAYYTIGQRRGLNIGGVTGSAGRWFVVSKDMQKNILIVSHGNEELLYSKEMTVKDINFIPGQPASSEFECFVKTRYRENDKKVCVSLAGNTAKVVFDEKERAITAGQYAVFYEKGGKCLGGGVIV